MVDNKATALSVAYDPSNAMSEAAFLHSPVTSAVSTNALAYQLRQGAGATTTRSDVKAKSDEVANLKPGQGQSRVPNHYLARQIRRCPPY